MFNDRPIEDARLQAALQEVQLIFRKYDLGGAAMLVSEEEAAFTYALFTSYNAVIEDETQPLGFRFRVKAAEVGPERAHAMTLATAHLVCQLKDFGAQTQLWMGDLLAMLRKAGLQITHVPFNGRKLHRLTSEKPR